jgi:hypothetical protein
MSAQLPRPKRLQFLARARELSIPPGGTFAEGDVVAFFGVGVICQIRDFQNNYGIRRVLVLDPIDVTLADSVAAVESLRTPAEVA